MGRIWSGYELRLVLSVLLLVYVGVVEAMQSSRRRCSRGKSLKTKEECMEVCKKAIALRRLRLLERDMRDSPEDAYMDCLDIVLSCIGDTDLQAVAESVMERICSLIEQEAEQSKYEQSIQH